MVGVISTVPGATPVTAASVDEPKYIRVCEKSPCSGGNILRLRFEPVYLHEVLPNEWPCSWSAASVKAGAIAARTYAWWRVEHPRSVDFDLYGSSLDQNYQRGSAHPLCDDRIEATAGTRVEYNGKRAFAAYRAETGDPTADGGRPYLVPVRDRHSDSPTTGPGVCQRGSQHMATGGSSSAAILTHYYTGVMVVGGAAYFVSEAFSCGPHGRVRIETWVDTSDGTTFTRTYPQGACPD
jgi:peptidoglycan hydrolase-like amidase